MSKADFFLKKTLGDDFFESLNKFELWKPGTKTTIDHEEIHTALKIVPRTVLALLIRELTPMELGQTKEVQIPDASDVIMNVTKHERDVYSGDIKQDNKVIVDFKYRSIPGIGLVIMSALELYDVNSLKPNEPAESPDISEKVQKMIDERLSLHDLVNRVVDQKLAQKDAVQQLILARITESLKPAPVVHVPTEHLQGPASIMEMSEKPKKGSPLGSFLEQRKTKPKKEVTFTLAKGEHVNCPDCGGAIFDGQVFSGCICVGDDMGKKVFLKKTESGVQVRFSKGWDLENIEMLLEVLRKKNG